MKQLLEIAAFNLQSALVAGQAGADRIELCDGLQAGGITPDIATIRAAREQLRCPFFVMIRPRGGDFAFTPEEISVMVAAIKAAKPLVDGFVFGVLTAAGEIDMAANKELIEAAYPLSCTFHRAFDDLADKEAGLEMLIECGFQRVLTSGGPGNAIDYANVLAALVKQADGRIVVMPGGGVRTHNLATLRSVTGAVEYHSAALPAGSALADPAIVRELKMLLQ